MDPSVELADTLTRTMRDLRRAMHAHERAFTLWSPPRTPAATGIACTVMGEPSLFLVRATESGWRLEVFADLDAWETNRLPRFFLEGPPVAVDNGDRVIGWTLITIVEHCDIEF